MERIFTLAELEEMKKQTREAIKQIIEKELTVHNRMTAAQLAKATNGLCSSNHIASSICCNHYFSSNTSKYNDLPIKITKTHRHKVRHFAELDDCGNIIRTFNREESIKVNAYSLNY